MDIGNTYANNRGDRATLYLDPWFTPPASIDLERDGVTVTVHRVDPAQLECRPVADVQGACDSFDCHRIRLGECACGRHDPERIRR